MIKDMQLTRQWPHAERLPALALQEAELNSHSFDVASFYMAESRTYEDGFLFRALAPLA